MLHPLRDIAVLFDASDTGNRVLNIAADLAQAQQAHLVAVSTAQHPTDIANGFARGAGIAAALDHEARADAACTAQLMQNLRAVSEPLQISTELRIVSDYLGGADLALQSLYCDLIIAGYPRTPGAPSGWHPLGTLRQTGVPMLLVPPHWQGDQVGHRIVVAWNASKQARRAVADALPLLARAQAVHLLMVDTPKAEATPGTEMAQHLSRHGVEVEIQTISSSQGGVAAAIRQHVLDADADLLVLGPYSRSRVVERVLGGVTEDLLAEVPAPLFVSH
ncbi:universal stress protein [Stenotrophomonas maltophilia]|uniref:universal stress protein n=1 Tax=Stenotrophomonas geniculata TaxID=86188 RepID=UPI001F52BDE7|nr:universal stress protein [Stenotrophomonas geniculata]MCI1112908.1 universal stress protein [Stenotrophomonas maltophilia]